MENTWLTACRLCVDVLLKSDGKPPLLSLANNLWIGEVPWELQRLTFAKQLLIALLYTRVYVFKLFPKACYPGLEKGTLQRAMGGMVSTYDLDVEGAAAMVQGRLLPERPRILASMLSITFVSVSTAPKGWLRSTFKV